MQIYDLYSGAMMSLCHRYASSEEVDKDIFQDAFVRVFENLHSLRNHQALTSWIKKIFVNEALQRIKNDKAEMMLDLSDIKEPSIEVIQVLEELSVEEITKVIRQLPFKMRVTFNMYVIEGYSHAEIAQNLGISIGTSKSNLHDARMYLQKQLNRLNQYQKSAG